MKRRRRSTAVALCVIVALVGSAAVAVAFHEPDGFGKATFGMSLAKVTTLYPKSHPAKIMEDVPGKGPRMLMLYELDDESVGPLKHCNLELRFLNDELFEIQFRCPDRIQAGQYLMKTYGTPTRVATTSLLWLGQHSSVSFDSLSGAFAYSDLARIQELEKLLKQAHASPP